MENKYIIIAAVLGFIGTFFEPHKEYEIKKRDYKIENKAEICIDSLRQVNDSLINALKIENRLLKSENNRLKKHKKRRK
jgi:hypothetical protein